MADTIREQIIQAIIARAGTLRAANGYNTDCGQGVKRAEKDLEPKDLPAVVAWPQPEEAERRSGKNICTTQIKLETYMEFGAVNPSVVQEQMLGDLIKCVTDPAAPVTPLLMTSFIRRAARQDNRKQANQSRQ